VFGGESQVFLGRQFYIAVDVEFPFARTFDERQVVMSKKILLAATAITAAMIGSAHASQVTSVHLVCYPDHTLRSDPDPIARVDVVINTEWRPNGTVAGMDWSVAHHSAHGATFYREQQYVDMRWSAWPDRGVYQWTGHLGRNYPVFMTGEWNHADHAATMYVEYTQNNDHPWEGRSVVSRNICHDAESGNDNRVERPVQTGTEVKVTEGLHLREHPSANSRDVLNGAEIPQGTTFNFPDLQGACVPANNGYLWCKVTWWPGEDRRLNFHGWISAYYIALSDGTRVAFLRPRSEQCAEHGPVRPYDSQPYNQSQSEESQPYTETAPTMENAPKWLRRR
jgi:hypothetical protein